MTGDIGTFKVTNKDNIFKSTKSIKDDSFSVITISPGSFELESVKDESERIIFEEGHFTAETYPLLIKPNFSTFLSKIETKPTFASSQFSFVHDGGIRHLLGFDAVVLYKKNYISPNPFETFSFDIFFPETDFAKGNVFQGKGTGENFNFTMVIDLG